MHFSRAQHPFESNYVYQPYGTRTFYAHNLVIKCSVEAERRQEYKGTKIRTN